MLQRLRTRRRVGRVGFWFHSIDVGAGVVTPGQKTPEVHARELAALRLPELRGRSVLDVGGWDGYYAFHAEQQGARRVAVLDHYMWAMDVPGQQAYWRECRERGVPPRAYHETEFWHPEALPGKRGFDTARDLRGSRVEAIVGDLEGADLEELGRWDVVLYLGVLYHVEDPLPALRRLRAVTGEIAVIETEAVLVAGLEDHPLWELFPTNELNHDVSNWWAPNAAGLLGAVRAAGFAEAELVAGPPPQAAHATDGVHRYRAIVHARA